MENDEFDALTRTLSGAGSSRRQALRALGRALFGGTLGGVATRLGLDDVATAKSKKPKKHGKRHDDRKASGALHAAGKKGKKHNNKHHHKKPKDPPQLCDHLCEEQGGRCCPDGGGCAEQGQCCPGEKMCGDEGCIADDFCCSGERHCNDGSCLSDDLCCPEERRCPSGSCLDKRLCCGSDRLCADGSCIPEDQCCPEAPAPSCDSCSEVVCDNGELVCQLKAGASTCQDTCPHGSPDFCTGDFSDWQCGGTNSHCYCMRSTSGDTHCAAEGGFNPSAICQTDGDCAWYFPGEESFCNHCNHVCYRSGCTAT
jgi:hypothetical protein